MVLPGLAETAELAVVVVPILQVGTVGQALVVAEGTLRMGYIQAVYMLAVLEHW